MLKSRLCSPNSQSYPFRKKNKIYLGAHVDWLQTPVITISQLKKKIHHSFVLCLRGITSLTLSVPVTKIAEIANSVDLDEVAHHEPPHLDLLCLRSSL